VTVNGLIFDESGTCSLPTVTSNTESFQKDYLKANSELKGHEFDLCASPITTRSADDTITDAKLESEGPE